MFKTLLHVYYHPWINLVWNGSNYFWFETTVLKMILGFFFGNLVDIYYLVLFKKLAFKNVMKSLDIDASVYIYRYMKKFLLPLGR